MKKSVSIMICVCAVILVVALMVGFGMTSKATEETQPVEATALDAEVETEATPEPTPEPEEGRDPFAAACDTYIDDIKGGDFDYTDDTQQEGLFEYLYETGYVDDDGVQQAFESSVVLDEWNTDSPYAIPYFKWLMSFEVREAYGEFDDGGPSTTPQGTFDNGDPHMISYEPGESWGRHDVGAVKSSAEDPEKADEIGAAIRRGQSPDYVPKY